MLLSFTYNLIMRITLAVILMIATSQVKFFIGSIPVTFQTLIFFGLAFVLEKKELFLALLSWSLLGFLKIIPTALNSFFITSASLGYILGLIVGALLISKLKNYFSMLKLWMLFISIVFLFGITYLSTKIGIEQALKVGFYPFILLEYLKYIILKTIFYKYKKL